MSRQQRRAAIATAERERELCSRTLNCAALKDRAEQGVIPKVWILGSGLGLTGSGLAGLAHRHGAGVTGLHPGLHLLHAGLAWGWPSQGAAGWGRASGGHCGTVVAAEYLYRTESRERERVIYDQKRNVSTKRWDLFNCAGVFSSYECAIDKVPAQSSYSCFLEEIILVSHSLQGRIS